MSTSQRKWFQHRRESFSCWRGIQTCLSLGKPWVISSSMVSIIVIPVTIYLSQLMNAPVISTFITRCKFHVAKLWRLWDGRVLRGWQTFTVNSVEHALKGLATAILLLCPWQLHEGSNLHASNLPSIAGTPWSYFCLFWQQKLVDSVVINSYRRGIRGVRLCHVSWLPSIVAYLLFWSPVLKHIHWKPSSVLSKISSLCIKFKTFSWHNWITFLWASWFRVAQR
jgi:hypothetical protein